MNDQVTVEKYQFKGNRAQDPGTVCGEGTGSAPENHPGAV